MKVETKEEVGLKHSEGKLMYDELDWKFIEGMAKKMTLPKLSGKYPKGNWKKPLDVNELLAACQRHLSEVWNGNFVDEEDKLHHCFGIAANAMMIYYQLKNNNK